MVIFNDGYYHPLDREYGQVWTPEVDRVIEPIEKPIEREPRKLTTKDIGTSVAVMQPGAESLKGRIWHGASRVELAFMGAGKGSKEGLTPGTFGKEERQAMRDLSRINEVEVSTHASVGVGGLAGFSSQESSFNESSRKFALEEVKRAIDFAADVSTGGAVVVHTGEFPRSIAGYYGEAGIKKPKIKFIAYGEEEEKAIHYLVDEHTGRIISGVREDEVIWRPVQEEDPSSPDGKKWLKAPREGTDKIDVAQFEMVNSYLKEIRKKYKDNPELIKRAEERFEDMKRIPVYKTDPEGNIQTGLITFKEFKQDFTRPDGTIDTEKAAIEFFKEQQGTQMHQHLGSAREFEQHYIDGLKEREGLKEVYNQFQEYKKRVKDPHLLRTFVENGVKRVRRRPLPEFEDPGKFIREVISENEREIAYGRETSTSGRLQARAIQDRILHVQGIEDFGVKKSADTLAEAGMFAMEKTRKTNEQLKKEKQKLIEPIYIAPENIFPESFGSHPQELKEIILESREAMAKKLVTQGRSEKEAEKLAEKHIAGTFDIGHAHIWKKYFKTDPNKSIEENEKDFNKWLVDEAKDLVKKGIVKHIHITDNLGFHDEHLAIGEGTAPIRELVKELEEAGLKDVIIEPGSTNLQTMWPVSMKALSSPIYAAEVIPYHQRFDQIHQAYAGQINPPYFLVGPGVVPSEEEWKLWSGVPLE